MIWRPLALTCAAWVFAGCAEIIGIEDLPDPDTNSPETGMYSDHGPGYPMFEYEGLYPSSTPCRGEFQLQQRTTGTYQDREIALEYFYHDDCGSFARIEDAPEDCVVILDRSTDAGVSWAWVRERVEPGLDFAYTMMGNNLEGRVSRGALVCNGLVIVRTDWW
jgi:hypothetical protein